MMKKIMIIQHIIGMLLLMVSYYNIDLIVIISNNVIVFDVLVFVIIAYVHDYVHAILS